MDYLKLAAFVIMIEFPALLRGSSDNLQHQLDFLDSEKDEWVDAHNYFRRQVENPEAANMRLMTWDDELEELAKKVVSTCSFTHTSLGDRYTSVFPTAGENLYAGGLFRISEMMNREGVTKLWFDEVEHYNYSTTSCANEKVCGHYTQVAWATSYKVGCALAICSAVEEGSAPHLVSCNYGPGGNIYYPGGDVAFPTYLSGEPCSQCDEGDLCVDQLCNNTERDIPFTTTTTEAPTTTPEVTTPATVVEPTTNTGENIAAAEFAPLANDVDDTPCNDCVVNFLTADSGHRMILSSKFCIVISLLWAARI